VTTGEKLKMTDRKPQPGLPREQVDNLEKALAALRKPPDGQRFERGKTICGQLLANGLS
jgi:hypothetical protein